MDKRVIDILQDNMDATHLLSRCGLVSINVISDYSIYVFYSTLTKIPSKMDRYEFTAESMGCTSRKVAEVVSKMEKTVKTTKP